MKTEKEKKKFELTFGPDGKPIWPKRPEMTPERLEAIKQLDELRSGKDEDMPEVPLAAIVYVKDYTEIPLANEAYALITVTGEGNQTVVQMVFDDLTREKGHFKTLFNGFTPGENLTVGACGGDVSKNRMGTMIGKPQSEWTV
ncbi:MAG: hypothetical protein II674_05540, partial [Prevotella sp.]|nr:hypothetical protein [Prevotella sp.]